MKEEFIRNAIVTKIVDGDTCDLLIDLGFHVATEQRVRLLGINTPERGQPNYNEATDYLKQIMPVGAHVVVKTSKDRTIDKYGRYLAVLNLLGDDTVTINDKMLASQLAKAYNP